MPWYGYLISIATMLFWIVVPFMYSDMPLPKGSHGSMRARSWVRKGGGW